MGARPDRLGGVENLRPRGGTSGSRWGMINVELAYARTASSEPIEETDQLPRPSLWVVPDLEPARPSLPRRRPSRRAVVRAHVWSVPVSTTDDVVGGAVSGDEADRRIAEAVRLLSRL